MRPASGMATSLEPVMRPTGGSGWRMAPGMPITKRWTKTPGWRFRLMIRNSRSSASGSP